MEYEDSFLSPSFPHLRLFGAEAAALFRSIGRRSKIREVMRALRRSWLFLSLLSLVIASETITRLQQLDVNG